MHFESESTQTVALKLQPLLLCGGLSSRMGKDKALIKINHKTQLGHLSDILQSTLTHTAGEKPTVFVSCREDQTQSEPYKNYSCLVDYYQQIGPMGGIITALKQHPNTAWLVLACDMPAITRDLLLQLLEARNPKKNATVFLNQNRLEPLCAIYEPTILPHLEAAVKNKAYSLTNSLKKLPIQHVIAKNESLLKNINTPSDLPI